MSLPSFEPTDPGDFKQLVDIHMPGKAVSYVGELRYQLEEDGPFINKSIPMKPDGQFLVPINFEDMGIPETVRSYSLTIRYKYEP